MEETMVKVAGVKFKKNGKMYYFDPGELELEKGTGVIVETARGMEFAHVTMGTTEIQEADVTHPLKKVVRIADEDDIQRHEENEGKKDYAMEVCREKIIKHNLDMKLIDVEFTFDNNKIIFYFTADGRVDFRDLVKDLASVFKMRIELRQVGVRDEAKMLGGIGCCGRELCCASWLSDFQPVSIKMTKTQNLSLNPTKISGVCGRLMCCLKYENSTYQELRKGMPDVNERVMVNGEMGKVIETNILRGTVKVRMFTGERDDNGREKMSSEILSFDKDEVERLGKKGSRPENAQHQERKCPCNGACHHGQNNESSGQSEQSEQEAVEAAEAEDRDLTKFEAPEGTSRADGHRETSENGVNEPGTEDSDWKSLENGEAEHGENAERESGHRSDRSRGRRSRDNRDRRESRDNRENRDREGRRDSRDSRDGGRDASQGGRSGREESARGENGEHGSGRSRSRGGRRRSRSGSGSGSGNSGSQKSGQRNDRDNRGSRSSSQNKRREHKKTEVIFQSFSFNDKDKDNSKAAGSGQKDGAQQQGSRQEQGHGQKPDSADGGSQS